MAIHRLLSNGRSLRSLFLISFAAITLQGCKLEPLKIDPCGVYVEPNGVAFCHAVPLNQPGKLEYEREVKNADICVTSDEYAELQKSYRELFRRCGDRCK